MSSTWTQHWPVRRACCWSMSSHTPMHRARATPNAGRTSRSCCRPESLNDVVTGITGIPVAETVPDRFFDRADEVVLVDLSAEELLTRLQAGKVYLPEQAERARQNFFRKGNLIALRELALRRTAER